jgi:plasmid stabilization system protein ParE
MAFGVKLLQFAVSDLNEAYLWVAARAPMTAVRWLERFQTSIESLAVNPERCQVARENRGCRFEVRELLFGKRPHVFRVLFTIREDDVRVLRIRRAQRRSLKASDIELADDL